MRNIYTKNVLIYRSSEWSTENSLNFLNYCRQIQNKLKLEIQSPNFINKTENNKQSYLYKYSFQSYNLNVLNNSVDQFCTEIMKMWFLNNAEIIKTKVFAFSNRTKLDLPEETLDMIRYCKTNSIKFSYIILDIWENERQLDIFPKFFFTFNNEKDSTYFVIKFL